MTHRGRAAAILLAALAPALALAGCDRRQRAIAPAEAADRAASPPLATRFAQETPDAKVELVLPPDIGAYPELHRALYDAGRHEMEDFLKSAAEDRARFARQGVPLRGKFERRIAWTITAVTPKLVGLRSRWFTDTGGAHPNHGSETMLWDRTRHGALLQSELFRPGYDFAGLDKALCDAVTRAKEARMGKTDPKSWSCPKWADSRAALVRSTVPARIGGLMFLFDPYAIGAYAEGDYEALIPLSEFRPALTPAWAPEFSGSPAPEVEPRP